MSEPFPFFQHPSPIQYDPASFSYNLGNLCRTCNKKVIYHESITPCLCYSYAHERCLLKTINQINKSSKQATFKCKICSFRLSLSEKNHYRFRVQFRMFTTIGLLAALMTMIGYVVYWFLLDVYVEHFIAWMMSTIVFALACCFFVIFWVNILIKKTTTFIGMRSTGLELKISAFENLDTFKDEGEQTQTQMLHKY